MSNTKDIYVSALFCDRLLAEADGVFSAIRIIDVFNVSIPPQRPNTVTLTPPLDGNLVAIFKSANPVDFIASVVLVKPDGEESKTDQYPVSLPGGVKGYALAITVRISTAIEGLYWCNVFVDREIAIRVPLLVNHTHEPGDTPTLTPQQLVDPSA